MQLPDVSRITSLPIKTAAEALEQARKTADEAKKSRVQAEQELPLAREQDAASDVKLIREGKKPATKHSATEAQQKLISELEHGELIAQGLIAAAQEDLNAAIDEHGEAYVAEAAETIAALDAQWRETVEQIIALRARHAAAVKLGRQLGIDHQPVAMVQMDARHISGVQVAYGSEPLGAVAPEALIELLGGIGRQEWQKPTSFTSGPNVGKLRFMTAPEEIEEREASLARFQERLRQQSDGPTPEEREQREAHLAAAIPSRRARR